MALGPFLHRLSDVNRALHQTPCSPVCLLTRLLLLPSQMPVCRLPDLQHACLLRHLLASAHLYPFILLPACLPAFLSALLFACLCLPICLSVSVCLSACLPVSAFLCLPACVCLSVCLDACSRVHLVHEM